MKKKPKQNKEKPKLKPKQISSGHPVIPHIFFMRV